MKLNVYAIFDEKACTFSQPFTQNHNGQAIRLFQDLVRDNNSTISKHPEDYKLYQLGTYDDTSGELESNVTPVFLVNATDMVKPN